MELDYDQGLRTQKDKRNEEKTTNVDENVFSPEALLEGEERHRVVPASTMAKKGFGLDTQIRWLSAVVSAVGTVSVVLSF